MTSPNWSSRANPATVGIGISLDEIQLANNKREESHERIHYPLLDLGLRRADCHRIITRAGLPISHKSACWFCVLWNLALVQFHSMVDVMWGRFPLVAGHTDARRWLQFTANLGRAANTVDAYGRALEEHLRFCALVGTDPLTIRADGVAAWIGAMLECPNPRSPKVMRLDSGAGLANATIQQRVVAVRSFYEFPVEDGLRERNPVRRGQSGHRGRRPRLGQAAMKRPG